MFLELEADDGLIIYRKVFLTHNLFVCRTGLIIRIGTLRDNAPADVNASDIPARRPYAESL